MRSARFLPAVLAVFFLSVVVYAADGWKAGVASTVITPMEPMWMAGYASRTKPAEGKAQDLFAKALALEDSEGRRLLLITMDLIGVPRSLREHLEKRFAELHRLPPEAIWLNASHTHCGPEFRSSPDDVELTLLGKETEAAAYGKFLEEKLVVLAGDALAKLQPAVVEYHYARCGFAMNRRLPAGDGAYRNAPFSDGPVDHDVPVLAVFSPEKVGAERPLRAVVFGYACHNTTMGFFQWCGDYAGYAQETFEADHPGTTAMFVTGCGGDQNPYPRGKLPYAQIHGRNLATAIEAALQAPPKELPPKLTLAFDHATLDFAVPSRAELEQRLSSKDRFVVSHAQRLLARLDRGDSLPAQYAYPVQVLRLGGATPESALTVITLGGEVVVDYSLRFKRELAGQSVWVSGYSNDVMGYIPSLRIRREGGYEAGEAMRFGMLPGPWTESVEDRIVEKVHALLEQTRPK